MDRPSIHACGQAGWPLCRAYLCVLVKSLTVGVEEGDNSGASLRFHWALVALSNGEYEVSGGWPESSAPGVFWAHVFDDLKGRGVERLRFVAADGPAMDEVAMRAAFPEARSLASITELNRLSFGEAARQGGRVPILPPTATNLRVAPTASGAGAEHVPGDSMAAREDGNHVAAPALSRTISHSAARSVLRAQKAAQAMQTVVCRAVARHGAFTRPAEAIAFVLEALYHAEEKTRAIGPAKHPAARNQPRAVGSCTKQRRAAVLAL